MTVMRQFTKFLLVFKAFSFKKSPYMSKFEKFALIIGLFKLFKCIHNMTTILEDY